jgi:hypothetical protein
MDNEMKASKVEHGRGTLPESVKEERMKTNRNIWEFKLSMEDMKQKVMEEVLSAWWEKWLSQVVALFPYDKWKEMHPSLNAGDVCLAKYGHKVDKADYQLCKVVEVEKDSKKLPPDPAPCVHTLSNLSQRTAKNPT